MPTCATRDSPPRGIVSADRFSLALVRKPGESHPFLLMHRSSVDQPVSEVEALYREHGDRLWRAMLLYTGDREVASDAVAEAFAQALHRGEEIRSIEAWIWTAAYRIAAGEMQRRSRSGNDVPEQRYEVVETSLELTLAMRTLSPMQRASVVLHDYAGYPLKEVARITGSTASAVSVHLVRAHRKMRRDLEVDDED